MNSAPPAYTILAKEGSIGPARIVTSDDWGAILHVMRERRIPTLDAKGQATDEVLKQVARLSHVTGLRLGDCRELTDEGLKHLAQMTQLEHLDIGGYPGGKLTDRGLQALRHLTDLRSFQMTWQAGVSDAGVANLRFCEKLEAVNVMGTPTGDGAIEALRGKKAIRSFDSGRLVTDAGLQMLSDFPRFRRWHQGSRNEPAHLLIDGPFTDTGLVKVGALEGVFELDLFWHVTGLTSNAFEILRHLPNLGSLGCDGQLSDDQAMEHIAAIPCLRKLRAQGTVATDNGFETLSRCRSLETFWGRQCPNLTGRGFSALSKMPALRALGVSCRNIDNGALALLSQFPALRELTAIDIQDDGFGVIGRCAGLERLLCMYCQDTTDVATKQIARLQLTSYYAGSTQITDRSLHILGRMTTLESLEFYQTRKVTDAGLLHLAELPRLREIHFSGLPNVTVPGTRIFPPHVEVEYNI